MTVRGTYEVWDDICETINNDEKVYIYNRCGVGCCGVPFGVREAGVGVGAYEHRLQAVDRP